MESLINFDSVNFYSKLEYKSKNSVLDAAFGLLDDVNFDDTENFKYINSFIIFIYSIICITLIAQSDDGMLNLGGDFTLIAQSDDGMLNLGGDFTDIKIFAYNLIYMYDNIDNNNKNSIGLYNNNDFNYIIDEFITNRSDENQSEFDENYSSVELVNHVEESPYMNNYFLIQTESIQDIDLKEWQICLYITVYYFILLVNDITNEKRKSGPLLLLKTLKYILLISYSINILITIDENSETQFYTFLENNSYFNNMYTKICAFFFNNDDGNFNYDILNYLVEIPDIFKSVQNLSSRILVASIETRSNLYLSLRIALINLDLDDPSINAQNNLSQIVKKINAEYDSFPLIEFYDNVLFTISENINNDIISNIAETVNEYNYLKNIYISKLENVFDTFIYNFLFYKNSGQYSENIKYLCDNINNIYKNKQLYNVFWDILFDTKEYAEYFFEHKINFYRKSLLIAGIDNFNSEDEENEEDEPCYDDFHLKNLQKLNSDENDFEYSDNLQIGHSVLGRKYNLQIPLTKKLFFTDVCYCGDNISLENFPAFFYNNEC